MKVLAGSRALEVPLVVCSAGAEVGPILDDRTALGRRTVRRTHDARTGKGRAISSDETATSIMDNVEYPSTGQPCDSRRAELKALPGSAYSPHTTELNLRSLKLLGRLGFQTLSSFLEFDAEQTLAAAALGEHRH
jgi:hypothetical protein